MTCHNYIFDSNSSHATVKLANGKLTVEEFGRYPHNRFSPVTKQLPGVRIKEKHIRMRRLKRE